MKTDWAKLVKEIMTENGLSERAVSAASKVNRSSLRRFLAGENMNLGNVERILATLGYELDIVRIGDPKIAPSISVKAEAPAPVTPKPAPRPRFRIIRPACMEMNY